MRRLGITLLATCVMSFAADSSSIAVHFVDLLAQSNFAEAEEIFTPQVKALMSAEQLAATWQGITAQKGAFSKQLGTRTEKAGRFDVVYVACQCL